MENIKSVYLILHDMLCHMQALTLMTDPRDIRFVSESFSADQQIRSQWFEVVLLQTDYFPDHEPIPNELIVASNNINKNFSYPTRRTVSNKTHMMKYVLFDATAKYN